MDLKQLKKLINEEVQRTRHNNLLKEQEKTGAGTPGAKQRQAAGILTPGQQRIKSQEELLVQDMKKNASHLLATIKNMSPDTKQFLQKITNSNSPEEVYQLVLSNKDFSLPPSEESLSLWSAISDIERSHSGQGLSPSVADPEMETNIANLRTRGKDPYLAEPGDKTAKVNPANAPTKKPLNPVNPIGSDEPTKTIQKTGRFSSLFTENKK